MEPIAVLESRQGGRVSINYYSGEIKSIASGAKFDAYIASTEDGFSPLGSNRRFLSEELGVSEKEIRQLADWNRFKNSRVTLIAIPTRRDGSCLRGVILAASESSECYKRFAVPRYGRPYRDFYYNVAYEAIAYASRTWGAQRLAISHLSGCNCFHGDIATCNAEALAHYCDSSVNVIESFTFLGDCDISLAHLAGISRLNIEGKTGRHRSIFTETAHHEGHVLVHLDWNHDV
ncbi:MAG: hypothetical protein Q8P42_00025 [Gallionella sp.]|nr:hypothetical protein [Gallionella sp.]